MHFNTPKRSGSCLAFAVSGLVSSACVSWFCRDVEFQSFIERPFGTSLAIAWAGFVVASIVNLPAEKQRLLLPAAVGATVLADLVLLTLAVTAGWLGGTAFRLPVPLLALVYGPAIAWYVALPLATYAFIEDVSTRWAAGAYVAMVLVFSGVSLVVLRRLLMDGTFVFARGYSLALDAAWGLAQYAFGLAIYRGMLSKFTVARRR